MGETSGRREQQACVKVTVRSAVHMRSGKRLYDEQVREVAPADLRALEAQLDGEIDRFFDDPDVIGAFLHAQTDDGTSVAAIPKMRDAAGVVKKAEAKWR